MWFNPLRIAHESHTAGEREAPGGEPRAVELLAAWGEPDGETS